MACESCEKMYHAGYDDGRNDVVSALAKQADEGFDEDNERLRETIFYFRKQFQRFTNKGLVHCEHDIELCDEVLGLTNGEKKELDNSSSGCPVSGGGSDG